MLKALVVEDEEDNRRLLVEELEDRGFQVVEACDGHAGVRLAVSELPDIIFSDVYMPIVNGLELVEKLNAIPTTAKIPVVLVTVMNALATEKKSKELGVEFYLTKPWSQLELDRVLNEVLNFSDKVGSQAAVL